MAAEAIGLGAGWSMDLPHEGIHWWSYDKRIQPRCLVPFAYCVAHFDDRSAQSGELVALACTTAAIAGRVVGYPSAQGGDVFNWRRNGLP